MAEARLGVGDQVPRVILVKPMTYMNLSGGPVAGLRQFYKVPLERVIAVHDELDIPYGQLRLKQGGGEGGHNGLRSISGAIGTKEYLRVRDRCRQPGLRRGRRKDLVPPHCPRRQQV